jgi:hypothetical protein
MAEGFRAERQAHHFRVIQSLEFTVGADHRLIAQLDHFRKKRNLSDYERSGMTSNQEAKEMIALAKTLRDIVVKWLLAAHPELMN